MAVKALSLRVYVFTPEHSHNGNCSDGLCNGTERQCTRNNTKQHNTRHAGAYLWEKATPGGGYIREKMCRQGLERENMLILATKLSRTMSYMRTPLSVAQATRSPLQSRPPITWPEACWCLADLHRQHLTKPSPVARSRSRELDSRPALTTVVKVAMPPAPAAEE